jgi:hypothetical protein
VNWADRVLPGGNQYQAATGYGWEGKGASWEYAVQLANETQTDMWINIPVNASPDYITKVADLIRYGSDGTNPYTSPQANPVYQGLDPNLKVYVEYSNEVWNPVFSQSQANASGAMAEVRAGGSPLNYDGSTDASVWAQRRVAEKIVQISNLFRGVFGDAQMGSRLRPVLEWWGGSFNQTAANALNFLNNYYDNADGINHVSAPHPVNYYVWGGGGSWYYGVNDDTSEARRDRRHHRVLQGRGRIGHGVPFFRQRRLGPGGSEHLFAEHSQAPGPGRGPGGYGAGTHDRAGLARRRKPIGHDQREPVLEPRK